MQEQNKKTVQPSAPRPQGPAQNLQKNLTARQRDSQQQKMAIQQNTTQQPNVANSHQKVAGSQIQQKDKKELNASLQNKLILSGFISMGISVVMFIVSIVLFLLIIFNIENSLLTSGIIFFVFAFIVGAVSVSLLLTSLKEKYNGSVANKNIAKETNIPNTTNMATKTPQSTMQPNAPSIERSALHIQHQKEKVGHSQKKAGQKERKEKGTKKEKKISK